ncbi:MAG: hypothetical protein LBD55_06940 [Treponema sp.]|jgi:hypothetical protein|nr:hypothetical protein [Treponema sp.]
MNIRRVLGGIVLCLYSAIVIPAAEYDPLNNETVPDIIQRPQRGEAPRYPQDTIIGTLGQGEASETAYNVARNILNAILSKNREAAILSDLGEASLKDLFETLEAVNPQKFRLGGGREEPDGSTSFLVRFVGRERWITGELYLRFDENQWKWDDLILEEPQDISTGEDKYRFDFSPYERFF